jgi:tetratricopeptide (TPR) repeat protein
MIDSLLANKQQHEKNSLIVFQLKGDGPYHNQQKVVAYASYLIGQHHLDIGMLDSAEVYLNKAIQLSYDQQIDSIVGLCQIRLGFMEYTKGHYDLANNYYIEAIRVLEGCGNKLKLSWAYNLLGLNFQNNPKPNYNKAIEYYRKSISIFPSAYNKNQGYAYLRLGSTNTKLKQYAEALKNINEALDIADSIHFIPIKFWATLALTDLYIETKDRNNAIIHCKNALNMSNKDDFGKSAQIIVTHNMAKVYYLIGNYDSAMFYSNKSITKNYQYAISECLPQNYLLQSQIVSMSKDPTKELLYYKRYVVVKDSIFDVLNNKYIAELEMKYDLTQKNKEILFLNQRKQADEKIKNFLMLIILLILGLISLAVVSIIKVRKSKAMLSIKNIEIEQKQKAIIDSINYAKRIQESLLPSKQYIQRILNR